MKGELHLQDTQAVRTATAVLVGGVVECRSAVDFAAPTVPSRQRRNPTHHHRKAVETMPRIHARLLATTLLAGVSFATSPALAQTTPPADNGAAAGVPDTAAAP